MNLLTDIGEAIKIPTPDGGDRFDGNVIPHNHFLCTSCGRLLDLELDMKSLEEVNRLAAENFDGIITLQAPRCFMGNAVTALESLK